MIPEGIAPDLTPEERAKIEKEDAELVQSWAAELSKDELVARLEAYANATGDLVDALGVEAAGLKALLWMCHYCGKPMLESVRMIRAKTKRTREENDALNAWNRYMLQCANQT